ncbi:hypothetical protein LTR17_014825 [Elasticomyces elasticus]|nr:hypothetical protein LTR17_014825 [Elasticomyces elasticus]
MLDPFSSLAIATAVCQFFDFGASVLSSAWNIYKEKGGDQAIVLFQNETERFKSMAARLQEVQKAHEKREADSRAAARRTVVGIRVAGPDRDTAGLNEEDKRLLAILQGCEDLAHKVIALLAKFQMKSSPSALQSLKLALKLKLHKDEVAKCQAQLEKQRAELGTALLAIIWRNGGSVMSELQRLQHRDEVMQLTLTTKLEALQSQLSSVSITVGTATSDLADRLSEFSKETKKVGMTQYLLTSFQYDGMRFREQAIPRSHAQTFDWIFSKQQSTYLDWLNNDSGMFWVAGKAGAGKSTLMRYLFNHDATMEGLRHWAKGGKLISSRHFFWRAGTPLQKSQTGLLRSLCHDIFRNCPDLLPVVLKDKWDALSGRALQNLDPTIFYTWTQEELSDMVKSLYNQTLTSDGQKMFFSFFIDGLDEYEGVPEDLIATLKSLSGFLNVKLCVSSRPWNAFDDCFGKDQNRMLLLQELTAADISLYVRDTLAADQRFLRLRARDERCTGIVQEITTKAQGVFLWVFLVIRELMKGLTNDDNYSTLQRRLRSLPPDLETFFKHMFDHLDNFYSVETERIFRVMLEAEQCMPLLAFAALETDDPLAERVTDLVTKVPRQETTVLCQRLHRHIQGRVSDLLEVRNGLEVDFLHRTVRDFLTTKEMSDLLDSRTGPGFDIDDVSCKMWLIGLRYPAFTGNETTNSMILKFFEHARAIEDKQRRAPLELVHKLQALLDSFGTGLNTDVRLLAEMSLPLALDEELAAELSPRSASDLLEILVPLAFSYLGHPTTLKSSLHIRGIWDMSNTLDPERRGFRLEVITVLLRYGATPQSVLNYLLTHMSRDPRNPLGWTKTTYLSIAKQAIEAGARIQGDQLLVVRQAFGVEDARWLEALQPWQAQKRSALGLLVPRWLLRKSSSTD